MKTINVNLDDRSYPIYIGDSILSDKKLLNSAWVGDEEDASILKFVKASTFCSKVRDLLFLLVKFYPQLNEGRIILYYL